MVKRYDSGLKKLVGSDPQAFVQWLVPNAKSVHFYKMHDLLEDSPIFQMIEQEGVEKGIEQGVQDEEED